MHAPKTLKASCVVYNIEIYHVYHLKPIKP